MDLKRADSSAVMTIIERAGMHMGKARAHLICCFSVFFIIGKVFSLEEPPMYFFYNVAIEENIENMAQQLQLAGEHGINTVAFHSKMPWPQHSGGETAGKMMPFFKEIEAANTNAFFIPRCYQQPPEFYREKYPGEFPVMPGVDFSTENHASLGSDILFEEYNRSLRSAVRYCENSRFGSRIPIYYIAAQETGEWIPYQYRSGGADRSPANQRAFRAWLARRYQTDLTLQAAWGDPSVTLQTASVPADDSGRFPMQAARKDDTLRFFYRIPEEQVWVDYSEYISAITVERIADQAEIIRDETGGKKKAVVFYGYVFDLPGSMNAHLSMGRLLRNSDLHLFGAPLSYLRYADRLSGGPGGAKSALDSLPLHGKKWITEVDIATYAQKPDAYIPEWYWDDKEPHFEMPKTVQQTQDVLDRIFAFSAAHRSTLWWMDLFGAGWYSDSNLWDRLNQEVGRQFVELAGQERAYTPSVAVIVDEKSRLYENATWSGFHEMYPMLRNEILRTGASAGFYYLDDYIEGRVPPAKVCIFVNLWGIDRDRKNRLYEQLRDDRSTAVWQYAPGWLHGGTEGVERMTGMSVSADTGAVVSSGSSLFSGLSWGPEYRLDPRIVIGRNAMVLARYSDGKTSAAFKKQDDIDHYLIGAPGIPAEALRRIFKKAGVHLWCSPEGVINTDGKTFVHLHASRNAEYKISIPPTDANSGRTERISLKKGESTFIKLGGD